MNMNMDEYGYASQLQVPTALPHLLDKTTVTLTWKQYTLE